MEQWCKGAYEHMTFDKFDYEMDNGQARLTDRGTFQGSMLRSNFTGLLQGHTGQESNSLHICLTFFDNILLISYQTTVVH